MPDQQVPRGPRLTDAHGNAVEVDGELARVFREAMNNDPGDTGESPPLALWWHLNKPDGGGMHVKVTNVDYDRWVITDVYVHGDGLAATDLQSVPLTKLDLIMNLLGYWRGEDDRPGSPPGTIMDGDVIADFINDLAVKAGYGQAVTFHDPDETGTEDPALAELRAAADDAPSELPDLPAAERPRLTRPDGTDPDGFAERVAAAYREYAPTTRAPAVKIADEAGVPVATARSWIREARRRGKLPEGRKGKAG